MRKVNISASQLLDLLRARHARDVFVAECKNGQSYGSGQLRLDAWAMRRSWARPHSFGYEIKVSRSDFLADEKWMGYLDYCTDFYFVCPPDVIKPSEVGDQAGLLWSSRNAARLYIKKKAPTRPTVVPENLYRYILMCRSTIGRDDPDGGNGLEYWKTWLAKKQESLDIGHRVSRRLAQEYYRMECENRQLVKQSETLTEREAYLSHASEVLGLSPWEWSSERVVERSQKILGGIPEAVERRLRLAREDIDRALKRIEQREKT